MSKWGKKSEPGTRKKQIRTNIVACVVLLAMFGGLLFGSGKALASAPPTPAGYRYGWRGYDGNNTVYMLTDLTNYNPTPSQMSNGPNLLAPYNSTSKI